MKPIRYGRVSLPRVLACVLLISTIAGAAIAPTVAAAQSTSSGSGKKAQKEKGQKKEPPDEASKAKRTARAREAALFFSDERPLPITLTANLGKIRHDKGDKSPWRPATLSYTDSSGKLIEIPTQIKTRGIWRLRNCEFPPIRFDFKRETTESTVFRGLDKPKLTSYCRDDDTHEQYVLQELQLYRIYGLLTPDSHKVRLFHVTYKDSASGKVEAKRVAFLYEEPDALAARLGTDLVKLQGAGPDDLEPFNKALFGVFEYFIGNTDFSAFALHNVELLALFDGTVKGVPYDFDFSGAVNARYATTDPKLTINRVRDRLFRGYCAPPEEYAKTFALFNEKKDAIYGLYTDQIGKLMKPDVVKETLKYYNDFYKTINDPRSAKNEIIKACVSGR